MHIVIFTKKNAIQFNVKIQGIKYNVFDTEFNA